MASPLAADDILFRQRVLSCSGFYQGALDGVWGKATDEADRAFFAKAKAIAAAEGRFDARTEQCLLGLRTDAQRTARRSLAAIRKTGVDARIVSGTRSYAEQAALFRQGRFGNPGPIVTKARAGESWHNFALAWDLGLFVDGEYRTATADYKRIADAAKVVGVEWGGDWRGFKDYPHYQLAIGGRSISEARRDFERGCRD